MRRGNVEINIGLYHAFERSTIACTTEVAHGPYSRPETDDIVKAGKDDRGFNIATCKTELVPRNNVSLAHSCATPVTYQVVTIPSRTKVSVRHTRSVGTARRTTLVIQIMRLPLCHANDE